MYFQTHAPMGLCTGWFITYVYRTAWRGMAWHGMAWLGLARRCRYSSCQTAVRGFLPARRVYAIIARVRFQLLRRNISATIRGIDRGSRRKICAKKTENPLSLSLSLSFFLSFSLLVIFSSFFAAAFIVSLVVLSRSTVQLRLMTSLLLSLLFKRYCYSSRACFFFLFQVSHSRTA